MKTSNKVLVVTQLMNEMFTQIAHNFIGNLVYLVSSMRKFKI